MSVGNAANSGTDIINSTDASNGASNAPAKINKQGPRPKRWYRSLLSNKKSLDNFQLVMHLH